jgi:hypothetical protein
MKKIIDQKEIITRELLLREKQDCEAILQQTGFDLSEFEWRIAQSKFISNYRVACLVFQGRSFYFQFDYQKISHFGKEPIRWSVRSPGYFQVEDGRPDALWEGQRIYFYDWLDLLKKELGRATDSRPSVQVSREGIFFRGQFFDAFRSVSEIISQAKREIVLIDGYADQSTLDLLAVKNPSSSVSILIKPRRVDAKFKLAATAFNKQYGNLSVRTSESFHDRFIFVDEHEIYHLGASLNHLGGRGFMFSRIEEPVVIDSLRKEFKKEWEMAPAVV